MLEKLLFLYKPTHHLRKLIFDVNSEETDYYKIVTLCKTCDTYLFTTGRRLFLISSNNEFGIRTLFYNNLKMIASL